MTKFDSIYQEYINVLEEGKMKNFGLGALAAMSLMGTDAKANDNKKDPTEILKKKIKKADDIGEFLKLAKNYIAQSEGSKDYLYDDERPNRKWKVGDKLKGNLTIGVGHLVKPEEIEKYRNGINDKQIQNLFNQDVLKHLRRTVDLFPKFRTYPTYVKLALLDGVFRGEHKEKHKTVQYINKDEWNKVPEEYIDRGDYKNAVANGLPGVVTRMDRNKEAFQKYVDSLKDK